MINNLASVFSFTNKTSVTDSNNPPAIIQWLFDGDGNDVYGRYNGYLVNDNATLWMSPGYAGYGSAVCFASNSYSLVNSYLDLTSTSFTISAWIYIQYNITLDNSYFVLFSYCGAASPDQCLQILIINGKLFFGFYNDDLPGSTQMSSNQWYHVAYVYNRTSLGRFVYLNGNQDGSQASIQSYRGNASQVTMGIITLFTWTTFRNGFIDKLTFVSRIKNATEILDEATLVAYYSFDNSYADFGPNQINNSTSVSTVFDSTGRFNQSLIIDSMNSSYFQTTGFYYLGQSNYSYSFSFINHLGYLTIQTLSSNGIYATTYMYTALLLNQWTHVSMTYSISNGIRLYVNGLLVNSNSVSRDYSASGKISIITVETCLQPMTCAVGQTQIVPSQFHGKIDEMKIYSRELSKTEVNILAQL